MKKKKEQRENESGLQPATAEMLTVSMCLCVFFAKSPILPSHVCVCVFFFSPPSYILLLLPPHQTDYKEPEWLWVGLNKV